MTSDRNLQGVLRSWLHEDQHEDATRVLHTVLDGVAADPQRRPRRSVGGILTMNKFVAVGLASAAVIAVLLIGSNLLGSSSPPPGGPPSESVAPSEAPSEAEPSTAAGLPEGPFLILTGEADDPNEPEETFPSLTVTIPAPGWSGEAGHGILSKNPDAAPPDVLTMIVFVKSEYIVYGDACHWETTIPDSPVTTVDEFIAALSSQGSREASEPVDITLDGYAGKSITLELPDDLDFTECDPGYGGSWDCGDDGMTPCGYHGGPDAIDTVYVLDFDGRIMAWQTGYYTGTSAEDVAELEAVVQSASFGE